MHFENLWIQAESTTKSTVNQAIENIRSHLVELEQGIKVEFLIGQILFESCALSKHFNVNTFAALQAAIHDYVSLTHEPPLPSADDSTPAGIASDPNQITAKM